MILREHHAWWLCLLLVAGPLERQSQILVGGLLYSFPGSRIRAQQFRPRSTFLLESKPKSSVFHNETTATAQQSVGPIPMMPSPLFQELASSQLEFLANSLLDDRTATRIPKIKSMALYLPQENPLTGQLEFTPAVLYPSPPTERVFIASDSDSGVAPTLPRTLSKLPGFAHAATLMPHYPMMISSSQPGVGKVEEVVCDEGDAVALSVPLFAGVQTVGVVLVTPNLRTVVWTVDDKMLLEQAAKSLSLALSMDRERNDLRERNIQVQNELSDSLHQVKNPIQALRTYGKLLQRRMADEAPQLLELTDHLLLQSDRLVNRLKPVDAIVDSLSDRQPLALNPVEAKALVPWRPPLQVDKESDENSPVTDDAETSTSTGLPVESSTFWANEKPQMCFLADILEPIFTSFRTIAAERNIRFDVEYESELPGIMAHPEMLQEAVINILDNAVKYVPVSSNRQPRIRVSLCRATNGVVIRVDDNGPGIPRSAWSRVFDRGVRLTASAPGSGLGLYLARDFVEHSMGGTLNIVEPALGGTSVEVAVNRRKGLVFS